MKAERAHYDAGVTVVSVSGQELKQLIPHRPPIVMIDRLTAVGKEFSETRYCVPGEGVFIEGRQLSEAGLIENIAQTIAAGAGYQRREEGKGVLLGFLSMLKKLKIEKLPECGTEIRTEALYENRALDFRIFSGRIYVDRKRIAECEIRIYIPEDSV